MANTDTSIVVVNVAGVGATDNSSALPIAGRQGEALVSEVHGKYYTAAMRDMIFFGGTLIAGVALPVNAATLVSKFTLWNPASSGVNVELIEFNMGIDSTATVVNGIGYVTSYAISAQAGGLPTAPTIAAGCANTAGLSTGGVSTTGRKASKAQLYSALTLTNAAVLGPIMWMGGFGAVTDSGLSLFPYFFNGKVVLPPDSLVTFVTSVAAETAAPCGLMWMECLP